MLYSSDVDLHKMGSSGGSSGDEAAPKLRRKSTAFALQSSALSNQLYNTLVRSLSTD